MKDRKSGYYWVGYKDEHYIAWYDNMEHPMKPGVIGYWHMCCANDLLEDKDFNWIDIKPIKRKIR